MKMPLQQVSPKRFCEGVCNILYSWIVHQVDLSIHDEFTHKVILNCNVLGVSMEHMVFCNCHATMIVTQQMYRLALHYAYVT